MDAGSDHSSPGEESAKVLELAGSGPVSCRFSIPSSFYTMFSSLPCLPFALPWYTDHPLTYMRTFVPLIL